METRNSALLAKFLKAEAEKLHQQRATPEGFISRIQLLLSTLEKSGQPEIMSENDLESILVSSKSRKSKQSANTRSFFDVVDLSMYRAN